MSKDPFGTYVAAGIASMFAIQMFVNVGMVIGIMPITGIPLPFVSYGGYVDARELRRDRDAAETSTCAGSSDRRAQVAERDEPGERRAVRTGRSRVTSPSIARADIRASESPNPIP